VIPELVDGVLPEGVHECTIDEVEQVFGRFQRSDQRIQLTKRLRAFLGDAARSGIVAAVVVDGSFVTAKEKPGDIDLIVALRADFDLNQELQPFEYNIRSKRMVRETYKFDVFVAVDGHDDYFRRVEFLSRVKKGDPEFQTGRLIKGVLRILL
jgi:hypothetical protein